MAFNITNLVNAVNAKSVTVGADSALDRAVLLTNDIKNASIYSSLDDLPTADSSNSGRLSRVGDANNANTKYYVSQRNRWNLIGLDDSDVVTEGQFPPFQGSNYGYASGSSADYGAGDDDRIDKFPFASDGNATDVGNLSVGRGKSSGQSSATHGYTSGGNTGPGYNGSVDTIDKFPFTSGFTTATDVGNLTGGRNKVAGQSSIGNGYGYNTGGGNVIDKFSFSTDGNATVAGNTLTNRSWVAGQSSATHGYTSGNYPPSTVIDKFPFSSDADATDVGDLAVTRGIACGQSSATHGYTSGGYTTGRDDTIDKFSFSTDGNATDIGQLSVARNGAAGQSSTTHGYSAGGYQPSGPSNVIDKFPFASDFSGTATDVGDLTSGKYYGAGQQY